METTFKLKEKNEDESYILIVLNRSINKEQQIYKFSTGYQINKNDWEKGFPKNNKRTKQLIANLQTIKLKLNAFIEETIKKQNRYPTKTELADTIKQIFGKADAMEKSDFKKLYNDYLIHKTLSNEATTITQIKYAFDALFGYNFNIQFADLNNTFADKYNSYLQKTGLKNSTINKQLKLIKSFLRWVYNNDFTQIDFSKYLKRLDSID
jgi:hypothetical protein